WQGGRRAPAVARRVWLYERISDRAHVGRRTHCADLWRLERDHEVHHCENHAAARQEWRQELSMRLKARVAGVGMIPFQKPGQSDDWDVMAETAIRLALADAGLECASVQQAYAGYVYGDSTAGQSAIYRVGCTGIPIINVNNNCSTGSTALYLARQMVELGAADCVLAVGFEQMLPGALGMVFNDRKRTLDRLLLAQDQVQKPDAFAPMTAQQFGGAGVDYQKRYGAKDETFGQIAVKARRHAARSEER